MYNISIAQYIDRIVTLISLLHAPLQKCNCLSCFHISNSLFIVDSSTVIWWCALSQTGFELGQCFLYPMLNTELLPPSGANTTICSGKRGGLLQQQISYILESFLTPSRKRFARLHFGSRKIKLHVYKNS